MSQATADGLRQWEIDQASNRIVGLGAVPALSPAALPGGLRSCGPVLQPAEVAPSKCEVELRVREHSAIIKEQNRKYRNHEYHSKTFRI